jgi:hypothetical protein
MCVARKTLGYTNGNGGRKEWDTISLTQFQQATGFSRQGIIEAIEDAANGKWIERRQVGAQRYEYRLTSQPSELVNSVDQSSQLTATSQLSRPELVNSVDTQKKEIKETNGIPASPPVEQTEKVQPTAPISNDYFGMRRPVRRERVIADGYTQDAKKLGVDAESYVAIFNALIDIAGWQDLVTLGDDTKLNFAKRDALLLIGMGHKSPDDIHLLADAYMKANAHWRNTPPQPKDLAEYASQLKAGVLREGKKENRPGANREIQSVKFAKPGDDIYA